MLIDLILDRQGGQPYEAREFYNEVMGYLEVFPSYLPVAQALDGGEEQDVVRELCNYVRREDYKEEICDYIRSVKWLDTFKQRIQIGRNVTDIMRLPCVYSCHKEADGKLCYLLHDWDAEGNYVKAYEGDWLNEDEQGRWSVEHQNKKEL
jgi:hypothetical protein